MNKCVIIIIFLALYGCSGKMPEEVKRPEKIKDANYKMTFTGYYKADTIREEKAVRRITNRDTVTYIYTDANVIYNDTLKICRGSLWFNGKEKKRISAKNFIFKGNRIKVYKIDFVDPRSGSCATINNLFVTDSLGLVIKKCSSFGGSSVVECGSDWQELQRQIKNDSVFFKI